jgi:hypothetical protein
VSKFFFFTDPALLDSQTATQAFGPAGTLAGKDRFRVTDLHSSSSTDIPAFAVCDGLICAQTDDTGTISLVLKPTEQPPFDFPFISYIIYKGLDRNSLLTNGNAGSGGTVDTSMASKNKLVDSVQKTWLANDNLGDPPRECLGLHLTPASSTNDYPDLDLSKYADDQPLDGLFYRGDANFQLPLVRGGWPLGTFLSTGFGLEIIIERIAYRSKTALARRLENFIEVVSLDPSVIYSKDDTPYFTHWHAKEECLNFIDPCTFWGSFFSATLGVWNAVSDKFDFKSSAEIYQTLLRGNYDDTGPLAGAFYNRNRIRFDIRNEHTQSLNYYKNYGDTILVTFDRSARIESEVQNYYDTGWPYLTLAKTDYPVGVGDGADVYFALPIGDNTSPLLFIAAGNKKRRTSGRKRFIEPRPNASTGFTERCNVVAPICNDGQTSRTVASYVALGYFKRGIMEDGTSALSSSSVAPIKQHPLDFVLRLPSGPTALFDSSGDALCSYNDTVLLVLDGINAAEPGCHMAVPFFATDDSNAYVALVPWSTYWLGRETSVPEGFPKACSVNYTKRPVLRQIAERYGEGIAKRVVDVDGSAANMVSVYFYADADQSSTRQSQLAGKLIKEMPILILRKNELSQTLAMLPQAAFFAGTAFVNFIGVEATQHDFSGAPYSSPTLQLVYLADDSGHVRWISNTLPIQVYGHGDL